MKPIFHFVLALLCQGVSPCLADQPLPEKVFGLEGANLLSDARVSVPIKDKSALVVVFLSAKCPCSNSHIGELRALAKDYAIFVFVGVHSNSDESLKDAKTYFGRADLPFPIVQDEKARLADEYKALKTPHAFVIDARGKILYQGGVSDSHEFEKSNRKYLREALADIAAGRPVKIREGRTLGCMIQRGSKHVL